MPIFVWICAFAWRFVGCQDVGIQAAGQCLRVGVVPVSPNNPSTHFPNIVLLDAVNSMM